MTPEPHDGSPWVAREAARRRRQWWIYGILAGSGFVVGMALALAEPKDAEIFSGGSVPPWLALAFTLVLCIAVGWGSLRMWRSADEVERKQHHVSNSAAATSALMGYGIWFFLWKGGIASEPSAHWLFLATLTTGLIAYGWMKFR